MRPDAAATDDSPNRGLSRRAALAIGTSLFVAIVAVAAGNFAVDVLLQGAADAVVVGLWLAAGFGYGSLFDRPMRVTRRATCDTVAVPRATLGVLSVTAAALGLGVINLLVLATGLAGVLGRPVGWIIVLGGVLLTIVRFRDGSVEGIRDWLRACTPGTAVSWAFAVPLAIGFVAASVAPGYLWKPLDPHPYDVLSYHLQVPREWYDAGRIVPLAHNSFSFFPMGMETHWLLGMHLVGGPWAGVYLCQFMSLAHVGLTVIAVVVVCRQFGVGPVVSRAAGLMTAGVPWVLMLGGVAYVESGVMLYTLLAAAWAMRAIGHAGDERQGDIDGDQRGSDKGSGEPDSVTDAGVAWRRRGGSSVIVAMTRAGACAGFACGMKYTAVAMTAVPLLALWPLVAGRRGAGRDVLRAWAAGALACGLVFAPWLVRNAVWSGNPVFPLASGVFGRGHFTADQADRYRTAHAPPAGERSLPSRLHAGFDRVIADGQFGYVLWPAAGLAAVVVLVRRPDRGAVLIVLLIVAAAGVWLLATHVMPRFLTPAVPLAVVLLAVAAARCGRPGAWVGGAVMIAQAVIGLAWTGWALSPGLELGRQGLFRLNDLAELLPPETIAARTGGDKIALIGEAGAFLYGGPSDRLLYRGVFDVNVPPGQDVVDGWLGRPVEDLRRAGYWVIVSPAELDRLTRTYARLPRPTPPWDAAGPTPLVLPPIR